MSRKLYTYALATLLLSGCIVYIGDEDGTGELEHAERALTLEASSLSQLKATAEAGSLEIVGVEGLAAIEVVADTYYHRAEDVILTLEQSGSSAVLTAGFTRDLYGRGNPRIDLLVRVPARFDLDVHDGSGHLSIRGVGSLRLEDGSGHTDIQSVRGDVWVKDGSGHLNISEVGGMVTVDDGSGNLTIEDAGGLTLLESGSGSLRVTSIRGAIEIDE